MNLEIFFSYTSFSKREKRNPEKRTVNPDEGMANVSSNDIIESSGIGILTDPACFIQLLDDICMCLCCWWRKMGIGLLFVQKMREAKKMCFIWKSRSIC